VRRRIALTHPWTDKGMELDGRRRVVITGVTPEIDGGRFAVKRTAGEQVVVEADVFAEIGRAHV